MAKKKIKKEKKTEGKKEERKKTNYEMQIMLIIFCMAVIILLIFAISFLVQESKKFNYAGLRFTKGQQGNLILYFTNIPLKDETGKVQAYLPLYFREDPRKLSRIGTDAEIMLKPVVAMAADSITVESCQDTILAAMTLSLKFFGGVGIKSFPATTNKSEADTLNRTYVNCSKNANYSIIQFEMGNESRITEEGNCYTLEFANCEIMNVTERFMLVAYAQSENKEI